MYRITLPKDVTLSHKDGFALFHNRRGQLLRLISDPEHVVVGA